MKDLKGIGELREIKAEINLLSKSDGSACLSHGQTTCLASVHGPVEVKLQNLSVEKASVEVYFRPKNGLPSVNDRFVENFVQQSCLAGLLVGLHPRTAYRIQLQEMEDDGGRLACCINATVLALLNCGLDMSFLLAAVYCVIDKDGNVLLDASAKELEVLGRKEATNSVTFVFDGAKQDTVAVHTEGKLTRQQYDLAFDYCKSASHEIFRVYKEVFEKFTKII